MLGNKPQFITLCLENKVLLFGDFILKSGKKSHYFFNAGLFHNNQAITLLGEFYADNIFKNIIQQNIQFDCLFGPAYKGIPLATATAIALHRKYNYQTSISFNRKETKDHGEGGNIIGQDLTNKKVLLIDDVMSAGTATKESIHILNQFNAQIVGIMIALNRQERSSNKKYQIISDEIFDQYKIPIYSIITLDDIIVYTKNCKEYQSYYPLLAGKNLDS